MRFDLVAPRFAPVAAEEAPPLGKPYRELDGFWKPLPQAAKGLVPEPAKTRAPASKPDHDPWEDRRDFALVSIGVFGLALMGWTATAKKGTLADVGALLLVLGYVAFSIFL